MSSLKLLHSGGNGVIISAPSSNPSANRTITLNDTYAGDGSFVTANSSGNVGINKSNPSYPFVARRTDASGIIGEFANSSGYGLWIGQASASGEAYLKTGTGQALAFKTNGDNERMTLDHNGSVEIKSDTGNSLLTLTPTASASTSLIFNTWADNADGRNWAIRNRYNAHGRLEFMRGTSNSNEPLSPVFTLGHDSNCSFAGALSKSSGSFRIDHPLPSKTKTHYLVHSFVEGPQADLIYRGKVDLVGGTATVNIDTVAGMSDGTFVLLNREVQCFTSNETGWIAVKGSVSGNVLTITAQDNSCTDTISWMVVGERKDPHMYDTNWTDSEGKVIIEPLKEATLEGE